MNSVFDNLKSENLACIWTKSDIMKKANFEDYFKILLEFSNLKSSDIAKMATIGLDDPKTSTAATSTAALSSWLNQVISK